MIGNPTKIVRLIATWCKGQKISEMSRTSMTFVKKLHAHGVRGMVSEERNSSMFMAPIVKEDV